MTEQAPKRMRRRRWPRVLFALLLLGVIGALLVRHYTRPQKLTLMLVEQIHDQLGAELSLGGDATYAFTPGLRAVLPSPVLKAKDVVLLHADSLRAAVPWHSLWSQKIEIERIELVRPVLDLDALRAWLAARPKSTSAPPDVRFVLHIEHGSVVAAGKTIAEDVALDLANSADLAAWLAEFDPHSAGKILLPPLEGSVDAAALQIGGTRLEGVHVNVRDDAPAAATQRQ
jgi:hypothetical protein